MHLRKLQVSVPVAEVRNVRRAFTQLSMMVALCVTFAAREAVAQTLAVAPPARSQDAPLPKAWVRMDLGGSFVMAPGSPTYVGYGIHVLGLRVEFPRFALLLAPRFSNSTAPAHGGQSMLRFDGSLGARYLFAEASVSPFVGGGITYGLTSIDDTPGTKGEADGRGAGAYAEAGWEFLRGGFVQFSVGLRADTPFYRAASTSADGSIHRYHTVVPLSLDCTMSVPWPMLWIR